MRRPCPKVISCEGIGLQPEPDWPVTNYSAEAPDPLIWAGIVYPRVGIEPVGCFYSRTCPQYEAQDCWGIIYTAESQEQADALALAASINCPPPPPDGPQAQIYQNNEKTAQVECANGTQFRYTVESGTMVSPPLDPIIGAAWQIMADEWAQAYALQKASELMTCIDPIRIIRTGGGGGSPRIDANPGWACLYEECDPEANVYNLTGPGASGEFDFSISAGQLPPGISLVKIGPASAELVGTFSGVGIFDFTIEAIRHGSPTISVSVTDSYNVFGIDNAGTLPDAKTDVAYSYQFTGEGDDGPYTYGFDDTKPSPPGWLNLSSTGRLTGTPTTVAGASPFGVVIVDASGHECPYDCSIRVTGPKITCPPAGQVCVAYNNFVTAVPAGCVFSGTPPAKMSMDASGHITGTPMTVAPFAITATAPDGTTNTRVCSFITNPNPNKATSAQDLIWTTNEFPGVLCGATDVAGKKCNCVSSQAMAGAGGTIYAAGCCYQIVLSPPAYSSINIQRGVYATIRNCSAGYNLTIRVDFNIPNPGPCSTVGSIYTEIAGITSHSHPGLSGTGFISDTYALPVTTGAVITILCSCLGPGPGNFTVSITPLTPP